MCSGEELSPPCCQVCHEQLFKIRFSLFGGARALQFYCGVCLLMVQVIGVITVLEEGLGLVPCKGKICGRCKVGCAQ